MRRNVVAAHEEVARLLLDDEARLRWRKDPAGYARQHLGGPAEREMLARLDPEGLDWFSGRLQHKAEAGEHRRRRRAERKRVASPPPPLRSCRAPAPVARNRGRPLVGLAYRPALFRQLLAHLDRIEVWEHTVDGFLHGGRRALDAMALFASQGPVCLHSVDLSVGSPQARDNPERLKQIRALIKAGGCSEISDHLAYSRISHARLTHFAPLWRVSETLELVVRNVTYLQDALSTRLVLENIAPSFDPGGDIGTSEFLSEVARRTGCGVHLDITNLTINHANGFLDAPTELSLLDLDDVVSVHLAGAAYSEGAVRDMHSFPVSSSDLEWLEYLVARMPNCNTVVIERDQRQLGTEVAEDLNRTHRAITRGMTELAAERERVLTVGAHRDTLRWIAGTFAECSTEQHAVLRRDLLEGLPFEAEPSWLPVLEPSDIRPNRIAAAVMEAVSGPGVAKLCLDTPVVNHELVSLARSLGQVLPIPQSDPLIARHTRDRFVLEVKEDGEPGAAGPSRRLFSGEPVLLHTELSWAPIRRQPRFVLLSCAATGLPEHGGQTVLASMGATARCLDDRQIQILSNLWRLSAPDAPPVASRCGHRIVFSHRDFDVPFEWCCLAPPSVEAVDVNQALSALLRAMYTSIALGIRWAPGNILVFDNTRWFHGRTRQRGATDRTLKRVLVGNTYAGAASMSW